MVSLLFMQILKYTFDFPVVAMVSCIPVKRCWVGTTYCQLGKARGNGMKVFGERLARLPRGHSSLRTDRRATCPSRATNSQDLRSTMLATTRILVFKLATARVFCYPPTTPISLIAPSLSARDQSVPTISSDKGSGTTPTASDSGNIDDG